MPTARGASYTRGPFTPDLKKADNFSHQYLTYRHAVGSAGTFLFTTPVAVPEPLPTTLQIYPRVNTTQAT